MESPTIHKTQVVIAGAGPTGLAMAAQLIRYGIDFIIIEKNETVTSLSKAIVVQARTLEIFQELGISDEAIRRGRETTEMNLFYKGKRKAAINLSGLGKGQSEFTFALSLEQSKTEKLLSEYLLKNGKQVQWKCELTHFEEQNDKVIVYYKDSYNTEQRIEALYLVGCDGAGSVVRHKLNLNFSGTTKPKLFYVADVVLDSPVINKDTLYMFMIPKGFVLFFPMEGDGHYRQIGVLPDSDDESDYQFSDIEGDISKKIFVPISYKQLRWFSTYKVHSRKAESFMQGRCFIAGDAAHIHTPAGGQGMNTGIQDTYNLAWKMAGRIRGEVNADVLKSYNSERTENAKHLLHTTDRMFDIMSGINPFWNFMRLNFFALFLGALSKSALVKRNIFPLISQTGIKYPESYLTLKSSVGKMSAGDRMHYFTLSNGRSIFSYLTEPAFKILYFGNDNNALPVISSKVNVIYDSFREIPKAIFGNATSVYVLLRPDNHISYIGDDINKCRKVLEKITRNV